jgi:hypothetical protein
MLAWLPVLGGSPPAGGGPVTASDNFTRANENPLSNSGMWTNGSTGYGNMRVNSNLACAASVANCVAFVTTPSFAAYPNQSSTFVVSSTGGGMGPVVRMNASGNGYRLSFDNSTTGRLARLDAGVATTLGSTFAITALTGGITVSLEINGTTINAYRDGVLVATRTDSTHATGAPGIYSNNTNINVGAFSCTSL